MKPQTGQIWSRRIPGATHDIHLQLLNEIPEGTWQARNLRTDRRVTLYEFDLKRLYRLETEVAR